MDKQNSSLKVLVVDDDEAIHNILKSVLENEGIGVSTANNGKSAQAFLEVEKFNAVISDINMPGGDGIELLRYIGSSYPTLPVILMTGFTELIRDTIEATS